MATPPALTAWFQQELAAQAPGMKVVIPPPGEGIELRGLWRHNIGKRTPLLHTGSPVEIVSANLSKLLHGGEQSKRPGAYFFFVAADRDHLFGIEGNAAHPFGLGTLLSLVKSPRSFQKRNPRNGIHRPGHSRGRSGRSLRIVAIGLDNPQRHGEVDKWALNRHILGTDTSIYKGPDDECKGSLRQDSASSE
jgi:hypothetical protein